MTTKGLVSIKDLVPWKRDEKEIPVKREEEYPAHALQREMNRWFDDFFRGFNLTPFGESWSGFNPCIDVTETDKEINVSAELPGLDENDIEVTLANDMLTISGEKKAETEDKGKNYYRMERSYGSFQRSISLPPRVETDQVEAKFKKGVLTIMLPKTAEVQKHVKRIPIKTR